MIHKATSNPNLNMTLAVIMGAIVMFAISFIPTYIAFKPNLVIQNKYSEEYRKAHDYHKQMWEK